VFIIVNISRLLCYLVFLFSLVACSSVQVSEDYEQGYDFKALHTFAWLPLVKKEYGVKDNDLLAQRITGAVDKVMRSKSYTRAESGEPDFYISYNMSVEQKLSANSVSGGVSIGRSSFGSFGGIGLGTGTDINTIDEATFTIDVTDPVMNKLVWRGTGTLPMNKHSSPEELSEMVNEVVEKILAQFPPGANK